MKKIMTTSNKLLLGLLVTILLFITAMLGIIKYHGIGSIARFNTTDVVPPTPPVPPVPPTPPVPGE